MSAHAPPTDSVAALLANAARSVGDRPALAYDADLLTYAQIEHAAAGLATELARVAGGQLTGQRVAIIAPNRPILPVALFATWLAGGIAVPLSARLREYELRRILGDAQPVAIVSVAHHAGHPFAATLAAICPDIASLRGCLLVSEVGEDPRQLPLAAAPPPRGAPAPTPDAALDRDVAALLYTSGSTGEPKGALVGHACLRAEADQLAEILALGGDEASLLPIPVSHAFGLACLLAAIAAQALTALVDPGPSMAPLADAAVRHRPGVLHGSPALFTGLLKAGGGALETVRRGLVGGAPSPPGMLEQLDGRGTRLLNVFGMTEIGAAAVCRLDDPPAVRYQTAGRPLDGYRFRTVAGELLVRGPYVTTGYYRRPDLSAAAFDGSWFRTGDLGSIDAGGCLRLDGRAKDLANVAGFNVFPAEVEGLLLTHPDVTSAAVVAVAHERWGEALKAFVVVRPGARLGRSELIAYARERIAGYKVPYSVELVDELPLLASGKPDRKALVGS